jgi:thiamine biosynthesis lipoprotein
VAAELRFPVMGTTAHVVVVAAEPAPLLALARARLAELEGRWSRFLGTSEVSRLTAAAGRPVVVSADTLLLVRRAVEGWARTGGLFDPTVERGMVALGYDRDLALVRAGPAIGAPVATPAPGCAGIEVDPVLSAVRLPAGTGLDPGGIGKGLAADLVTADLLATGAAGCLVNVGGDLRTRGSARGADGWVVTVPDPFQEDRELMRAAVGDAAVATSSRLTRRWVAGGQEFHHLLDPVTGAPVEGDVVAATVVAAEGWLAEVLSKAVVVGGTRAGLALLGPVAAVAVTPTGERFSVNVPEGVLR